MWWGVLALKGKKAEVRMGNITMGVPLEKLRLSTQRRRLGYAPLNLLLPHRRRSENLVLSHK